jgi:hypothetical protein
LTLEEIGGYDIRYKALLDLVYLHIDIKGSTTTSYKFLSSVLGLSFEIAVYDTNGVYSDYVPIN